MKIVVADVGNIGRVVTDLVIAASPRVLGVATGASPMSSYAEMVARRALHHDVQLCLLDEYVGLPREHSARYRSVIVQCLIDPLHLDTHQVHSPNVDADDLHDAADRYEADLKGLRGVDLQILGIGRNGHIGFNEPGTSFDTRTHVAMLSAATRADNARYFADPGQVPTRAITQGLATIAAARQIVLIATGGTKEAAITRLATQPRSTDLPASVLSDHPHITVVGDRAALAGVLHLSTPTN